eukprot:s1267_g26.t1
MIFWTLLLALLCGHHCGDEQSNLSAKNEKAACYCSEKPLATSTRSTSIVDSADSVLYPCTQFPPLSGQQAHQSAATTTCPSSRRNGAALEMRTVLESRQSGTCALLEVRWQMGQVHGSNLRPTRAQAEIPDTKEGTESRGELGMAMGRGSSYEAAQKGQQKCFQQAAEESRPARKRQEKGQGGCRRRFELLRYSPSSAMEAFRYDTKTFHLGFDIGINYYRERARVGPTAEGGICRVRRDARESQESYRKSRTPSYQSAAHRGNAEDRQGLGRCQRRFTETSQSTNQAPRCMASTFEEAHGDIGQADRVLRDATVHLHRQGQNYEEGDFANMQRLNAQAAERRGMPEPIAEEEETDIQIIDTEANDLRAQVQALIRKAFKKTDAPQQIEEIKSEEEEDEDDMPVDSRSSKRPRSQDPPAGPIS